MKIIIAGGRNYKLEPFHLMKILQILSDNNCTEIISGHCTGADDEGEGIAIQENIPLRIFNPNWNKYGKKAGPYRNEEMAKYADGCILLPGGKGTANMKMNAIKYGLKIWELK